MGRWIFDEFDQAEAHLRDCRRHGVEPDWQELMFDLDPLYDGEHPRRDRVVQWGAVVGFAAVMALWLLDRSAGEIAMAAYGAALMPLAIYRFVSATRYQAKHRRV